MKFKVILAAILAVFVTMSATGQNKKEKEGDQDEYDENYEFKETKSINVDLGVGLGLDYGGIGAKLTVSPVKHVGLFGSLGYNLNGAGYNFGIIGRFLPDGKVCPYGTLMYGYNAVIVVDGASQYNQTYYGPSFGAGIELRTRNDKFWTFGLLFPIRAKEYHDDIDALQNNPAIEMSEPLPIVISVGYHFKL